MNKTTTYLLLTIVAFIGIFALVSVLELKTENESDNVVKKLKFGLQREMVSYPAYITGESEIFSNYQQIVGVEVPSHPDLKAALVDCEGSTPMDCSAAIRLWSVTRDLATVYASDVEFQEGRTTTIWYVKLHRPSKDAKGGE